MRFSDQHKEIQEAITHLKTDISEQLEKQHRQGETVELLVVSKTQPVEKILLSHECGMSLFGENRVQEYIKKKQEFKSEHRSNTNAFFDAVDVHLIGTLQSNKVSKALEYFSCIQSVDSLSLLEHIFKQLQKKRDHVGTTDQEYEAYPIFLQIRCSQFDYKHGFDSFDTLLQAIDYCMQNQTHLKIHGLMTIAPFSDDEKIVRDAFALTRNWANKAWEHFDINTPAQLSMGMSHDYHLAIAEGSTMLRIGSKIFGEHS